MFYFCLNIFAWLWRTATQFVCQRRISCGRPPLKIFASGGTGQPAAAGFQQAASAASAGQAGTLILLR
jgi:hypothetical protein